MGLAVRIFVFAAAAGLCVNAARADIVCDADLDDSGTVDGIDLGVLLANWSIPPTAPGCAAACPLSPLRGEGRVRGVRPT